MATSAPPPLPSTSTGTGKSIFVTGATGHIGSAVAQYAVTQGYIVRGLSRSEQGDAKLHGLGVVPVRGDLETLDVLRRESTAADIVMNLADSFTDHAKPQTHDEHRRIYCAAVDAMAAGMEGTNKTLVISSGVLLVAPDPNGSETDEESPLDPNPFVPRTYLEQYPLQYVERGVKVVVIRLAPWVYGHGRSGAFLFLSAAVQNKQAVFIEDGKQATSAVHVDDVARLYVLAAEKAEHGGIFNATSDTSLTQRRLAEAIAAAAQVPVVSMTSEQAEAQFGHFLTKFLAAESRASSAKARTVLGWQPTGPGLLDEFATGSYRDAAQALMKNGS